LMICCKYVLWHGNSFLLLKLFDVIVVIT
jgi:hypothetical protein